MKIKKKEYKKLLELAYCDKLTCCHNRNWLFSRYKDSDELDIYMIDINNLKNVNDNEGHAAGDYLIKSVACKIMLFGDAIRYGGDEFILIKSKYDKFRPNINNLLNDIRISCGYVHKTKDMHLNVAINITDMNMYLDKQKKRI